jgi:hypothetical protein
VPVAGVPDGLVARAAVRQVAAADGTRRDRTDRAGRVRYDQVWLIAAEPDPDPAGAGARVLGEVTLRWVATATRRAATSAQSRHDLEVWQRAAASGAVLLLHDLDATRSGLAALRHVVVDPDARAALEVHLARRDAAGRARAELIAAACLSHAPSEEALQGLIDTVARTSDAERDPAAAAVVALAQALPADGVPLSVLATRCGLGTHDLDPTGRFGRIAARVAALIAGFEVPASQRDAREVWQRVGVHRDPWSSSLVGWRLPLDPTHPAGAVAAAHGPTRAALLSLDVVTAPGRLMLPPTGDRCALYAVENAALLAACVDAEADAPVVWGTSVAARHVLVAAAQAGWRVWVSADFEPGGLKHAASLLAQLGDSGVPWRIGADDYDPELTDMSFDGRVPATPWDPRLADLLEGHRRRVTEEDRLALLLDDVLRP